MRRFRTLAVVLPFLPACTQAQEGDYGRRPDWSLAAPDGKTLSAEDFDGKVVIVDFWATWCPPCRKEIPGFIALKKKYAEKGLEIVGFSLDRDAETHETWIEEQGLNYPSLLATSEEGVKVVRSFEERIGEIRGIPTALVIDRKGTIVYKHVGYGSPESFEKVVTPLF